jgi:hypothetical protein
MDEIGDFFNECTAAITEMVVVVTGALGLVDNILDHYPPEQPCERAWGEESDFLSCREEDNWKAYNNIKDIERPENKNDDNGSIFGLFGGGGDGEESDSGYSYEPASSVKESSGEWSIFGWSGSTGDYSVDTSKDYDFSTDYNSSSDYDSSDCSSYSDSSSDYDSSDYGGGSGSGGTIFLSQ